METIKFKITDLHCEACVKLSTSALLGIPGVKKADVDLKSGNVVVEADRLVQFDEIATSLKAIDKSIKY